MMTHSAQHPSDFSLSMTGGGLKPSVIKNLRYFQELYRMQEQWVSVNSCLVPGEKSPRLLTYARQFITRRPTRPQRLITWEDWSRSGFAIDAQLNDLGLPKLPITEDLVAY